MNMLRGIRHERAKVMLSLETSQQRIELCESALEQLKRIRMTGLPETVRCVYDYDDELTFNIDRTLVDSEYLAVMEFLVEHQENVKRARAELSRLREREEALLNAGHHE